MDKFYDGHIAKLAQEEIRVLNLKSPISINETEYRRGRNISNFFFSFLPEFFWLFNSYFKPSVSLTPKIRQRSYQKITYQYPSQTQIQKKSLNFS